MSEPYPVPAWLQALGGATVFGLFTGTDFGIVFGASAGALFVPRCRRRFQAGEWQHIFCVIYCWRAGCTCVVSLGCIKNRL